MLINTLTAHPEVDVRTVSRVGKFFKASTRDQMLSVSQLGPLMLRSEKGKCQYLEQENASERERRDELIDSDIRNILSSESNGKLTGTSFGDRRTRSVGPAYKV